MKRVAASEAAILTLARAIVGFEPPSAAEPILARAHELPPGLGPTALELLRETLTRGTILELVRRGGARRATYLSDGTAKTGRLWERHTPPALRFSEYPIRLLRWLVATPLRSASAPALTTAPATAGDQLFAYLTADLGRQTSSFEAIAAEPSFRSTPLVLLGFVDRIPPRGELDFTPLTQDEGAILLEALHPELTAAWTRFLTDKNMITGRTEMVARGTAERAVLAAFLAAATGSGRTDLTEFLVRAIGTTLTSLDPARLIANLERSGTFSERLTARRAALSFLPALEELRALAERARAVRFFDDGYDGAQHYLERWELIGELGVRRAAEIASWVDTSILV